MQTSRRGAGRRISVLWAVSGKVGHPQQEPPLAYAVAHYLQIPARDRSRVDVRAGRATGRRCTSNMAQPVPHTVGAPERARRSVSGSGLGIAR